MNNNVTNDVKEAIVTGISGEAVTAVMEDFVKSEKKTPEQFKDTVEIVSEMKNDKPDMLNPEYSSNLVQNNSNRIKEALRNGIEPQEIATEMTRNYKNINTDAGRKKLNFIARLISKMKNKERKKQLERQQQVEQQPEIKQEMGGIQKVYSAQNNNQNNG